MSINAEKLTLAGIYWSPSAKYRVRLAAHRVARAINHLFFRPQNCLTLAPQTPGPKSTDEILGPGATTEPKPLPSQGDATLSASPTTGPGALRNCPEPDTSSRRNRR